ncbi:MAG: hypothetical protein Q8Q89_03945 [bacterium]|nr:hypothetical protein [bacterium]
MTTTTYGKLKREIKEELLREFILPLLEDIQDTEGEYRQEFIKEVLQAAEEKPVHRYNRKTFLKSIS